MQTLVSKARAYLDARRGERVTLEQLARAVGASPFHLQRQFKHALGLSPTSYQREQRLEDAKRLLANGARVTDALFDAGYGSLSRFYEKASGRLGMAARDYRARGKGQTIAYARFSTALGEVLIAATARGLCSVMLGKQALERLREEFSQAELVQDAQGLAPIRRAITRFLAGDASLARIPLDIRGTVFQRKVWEQLRRIPAGETRSYGEIARAIGAPRAVRAVGSACGANPVALVVPCHRALRADGSLGGYAWGLERKKKLLAIEKRARK
jgi:AraC family transcriptional regulator of adaptative response/methylated-DNA-[protein]-cysteine methyltransferase